MSAHDGAVQIAAGSFVDQPVYDQATYLVETATVRLNHVALNAWNNAIIHERDYYRFDTDGEFETYINEKNGCYWNLNGILHKRWVSHQTQTRRKST